MSRKKNDVSSSKDAGSATKHGSKFKGESGATSSHASLPYHQIPITALSRLARRFAVGEIYHGRGNYMRAFRDGKVDIGFLRNRYDHAMEHLLALRFGTDRDDHIGAVMWFCCFADIAEQMGVNWARVLEVKTPEEEKGEAYGKRHDVPENTRTSRGIGKRIRNRVRSDDRGHNSAQRG